MFTANANSYFDTTARKDYQSSLAPLGTPTSFVQRASGKRGGMQMHAYRLTFPHTQLNITTYTTTEGKLEQYIVAPGG
jgi:hypothetical protein